MVENKGGMKELPKCPKCGKQNKITAKFCENCGTTLNEVPNSSKGYAKSEQSAKPANTFDQIKSWWNGLDKTGKAMTGVAACCLGVIIIAAIGGALSSDKNLISIGLYNATYDSSGTYHVDIDNSTTEYVISGYTEAGTNITVSSTDLNISAQRVNLTSNNTFTYKVKVPKNVDNATVRFDAAKAGKEDTYVEISIQRPSTQASTSTTDTTTDTSTDTSTDTTTDSEFSGLNHPSAVESVLTQFDHNYDNKIEFVDSESSEPDGQEEYAEWAVAAGFDPSDAQKLTYMFNLYDANGDGYWDIYELDNFYDDYYNN